MAAPKVLILRAPGTNCDVETEYAFELAGARPVVVHVNRILEDPSIGEGFQILCFPGGFSYGDDIAAGRILAQRLKVHAADLIEQFRASDRLVLGICNGFQVMMRLGIFFPPEQFGPGAAKAASLALNRQGRFEDRWVHLRTVDSNSVFLRGIDRMYLPMAHAEGRFVSGGNDVLERMRSNQQLGLRYAAPDGSTGDAVLDHPWNPNGAEANVAGISDPSGRIFGLMPHPERYIDPTHHPAWTRHEELPPHGDGLRMFLNAVEYFS
ncbi:MAG: phosphoribosylformylglycinamidine synthase subunit PurQ [Planctomycetota bacterium]|nr:MAG: phosphoribosylformylglycinamidine synthase subunit PurQ [Planctomycetota bacterium]